MTNIKFYHSEKSAQFSSKYVKSFSIETDELVVNGNISIDDSGNYSIHFFEPKIDTFGFKKLVLSNFENSKK